MSKLSRGNKGEALVIKELNKIKVYHHLINNFNYVNPRSNSSHQIDHILIHPYGIFVIETKNYYGEIINDTDDVFWLKKIGDKTKHISNPIKQNKSHSLIVNNLLSKEYDVISVIVFVKNNCPYTGNDNVINLNDLLLMIESYPYKRILNKETIDKIYKILLTFHSELDLKTHLESIERIKRKKEDNKENMAYAIESGLCPMCGAKLHIIKDSYSCPKCKYKFDLSR